MTKKPHMPSLSQILVETTLSWGTHSSKHLTQTSTGVKALLKDSPLYRQLTLILGNPLKEESQGTIQLQPGYTASQGGKKAMKSGFRLG